MDLETAPAELAKWLRSDHRGLPGRFGNDLPAEEGIVETGAAIAAGVGTRLLLKSVWKLTRGTEPPVNPADSETRWSDALMWAASVGAAIGVARVLARRGTAAMHR